MPASERSPNVQESTSMTHSKSASVTRDAFVSLTEAEIRDYEAGIVFGSVAILAFTILTGIVWMMFAAN